MDMNDLRERLEIWQREGLMQADQAARIVAFEETKPGRRFPPWMEAVAYLGAALIILALIILAAEIWEDLNEPTQLISAVAVTVLLLAAGVLLRRADEPAAERAGGFAWLLAVVGSGFAGWIFGEAILELRDERAALLSFSVALLAAIPLWMLSRTTTQVIGMGLAFGFVAATAMAQVEPTPEWGFGVALAAAGTIFMLLTWAGILEPARPAYAIGALGVLSIGFFEALTVMPWPVVGLAVTLGLMALAVRLEQGLVLGISVVGLFIYVPATVFQLFGDSVGVPVALLITGVVLILGLVLVVRLRREV